MADLELPAYRPVYPISKSVKPRQVQARFPSAWGTEQRKTVGQNQTAPEWNVKWILQDADADILDDFLYGRARNNECFLWSPPGYKQAKYRCDTWTKTRIDLDLSDVQATFKRIYDYNNFLSIDADNGHIAFYGYTIKTRVDFYVTAERGLFELNELLIDDFTDLIDSLADFDEAYEIGASFGQTHIAYPSVYQFALTGGGISPVLGLADIMYPVNYQFVLTGGNISAVFGVASDYWGDISTQLYGWEGLAYIEWWGN